MASPHTSLKLWQAHTLRQGFGWHTSLLSLLLLLLEWLAIRSSRREIRYLAILRQGFGWHTSLLNLPHLPLEWLAIRSSRRERSMEVTGIEPASWKLHNTPSTCLERCLSHRCSINAHSYIRPAPVCFEIPPQRALPQSPRRLSF